MRRRDYLPIGKSASHGGISSSCLTGFLGVICAVAVLSLFSVAIFSMLPGLEPDSGVSSLNSIVRPEETREEHEAYDHPKVFSLSHDGGEELRRDSQPKAPAIRPPGQQLQRSDAFKMRRNDVGVQEVRESGSWTMHSREWNEEEHNHSEPHVVRPPDEKAALKMVASQDMAHEGTRQLSPSEQKGSWRLTEEVFNWAKKNAKAEVVSEERPLAMLFRGFLSLEETQHMVDLANSHLARSKVVSMANESMSDSRTSYGAWLSNSLRDEKVVEIEHRIHDVVGIPHSFGEGIYVLRYEQQQKYDPHTDNCGRTGMVAKESCVKFLKRAGGPVCGDQAGGSSCGDRIATFIMYLKAPNKGGATVFPHARLSAGAGGENRKIYIGAENWWCENDKVLGVSPHPGDAILFWSYVPKSGIDHSTYHRNGSLEDGSMNTEVVNDPTSLHGACPIIEGEKWVATRWIRSSLFK